MNAGPEPLAYSLPDFLERFSVSRSTAYREINSGRLEARKRGSRTIITAEAAQAWLNSLPSLQRRAAQPSEPIGAVLAKSLQNRAA